MGLSLNVPISTVCNVADADVRANIESACARGLREITRRDDHDGAVCVVGGAPSLDRTMPSLRAKERAGAEIWALNGAHDWLVGRGIVPHGAWLVDSRPHNAAFFKNPRGRTTYYIASRCHPLVFDTLADRDATVRLWHCDSGADLSDKGRLLICGGHTVGLKAVAAAFTMGYREIHLYGFDSSYREAAHHAYAQPANDGEPVYPVEIEGRKFHAAGWMIHQARDFAELSEALAREGAAIHVHGDGLLPAVARSMQRQMEAA